jgi:hypothetical protein
MSSDINVQTFSGKVNITSNLLVGSSHLFVDTTNNRVGLVTVNPDAGLHVNSNAYVDTDFRVGPSIVMNDTSGQITAGSFVGDGSGLDNLNSDSGLWTGAGTGNVHLTTIGNKVGIGTTTPTSNLHVLGSATIGTTKTFVVTVGSNGKYEIDGVDRPFLQLHQHQTYIFDVSSLSAGGHVFALSTTAQGTHGGGSEYVVGVSRPTNQLVFDVPVGAPSDFYYYCTTAGHTSMGSGTPSKVYSTTELVVSGRTVTTDLQVSGTGGTTLGSGTTAQRPAYPLLGTMRYNTTTRYMESYTEDGWGSIAPPPVITGFSPTSVFGGDTATQVFTVTGTGFDQGLSIKLVGADGTAYSAFDATYLSRTSATFKMGAHGATDGYDVAQKPFNVKVIGGSGIASISEDSITIPSPTITGLSNNTLADGTASVTGSHVITVTGTGFTSSMASGNDVQVLGVDGSTLYNVDSVVVASDGLSLTLKLSATGVALTSGQLAQRPYKVRVTGDAGLTATSTATIGFTDLSWTTQTLNTYSTGTSSTQNLVATDEVGGNNVTFSIYSGSVSGLNLGSTGASPATYGGTPATNTNGTTSVTFRVTDNVTLATLDKTFSIVVNIPPKTLTYNSSVYTSGDQFTINHSRTEHIFSYVAGLQVKFKLYGGAGGRGNWSSNDDPGGVGGFVEANITFNNAGTFYAYVGNGNTTSLSSAGSGGGSTDIRTTQASAVGNVLNSTFISNFYSSMSSALLVAGGGGGSHGGTYGGWGSANSPGSGGPTTSDTNSRGTNDSNYVATGASTTAAGQDGGASMSADYTADGVFGGGGTNSGSSAPARTAWNTAGANVGTNSFPHSGYAWPNGGTGSSWASGGGGGGYYGGATNWPNGGGGSNFIKSGTANFTISTISNRAGDGAAGTATASGPGKLIIEIL